VTKTTDREHRPRRRRGPWSSPRPTRQHPNDINVSSSDLSTFIKESRDGLLKEGGLGALFAS
jgi:hypothetical protein